MTNHRGACLGAELQTNPSQHCKSGPQRVLFSLKQRVLVYQMVSESGIKTSPVNLGNILFVHGDELFHSEALKNAEVGKALMSKSKRESGALKNLPLEKWFMRCSNFFLIYSSEFELFHSNSEKPWAKINRRTW